MPRRKTNNLAKRLSSHLLNKNLKQKTKKNSWIKSLLSKNIKPEILLIDEVPEIEWKFWEKHYISLFKSWGFNLTNLTEGGDGINLGYKFSKETRKKMSNSKLGVKFSKEHKKKISESNKGNKNFLNKKHSEDSKNKIRTSNIGKHSGKTPWNKGKTLTSEYKEKISNSMKGRIPWNKGLKKKINFFVTP